MKRSLSLFIVAVAVVSTHVVLRFLGCAEHTSVIVGMPQTSASYVLGPTYVLTHLATVFVAPAFAIAALLEWLAERIRPGSPATAPRFVRIQ